MRRFRWVGKQHPDYVQGKFLVRCTSRSDLDLGSVVLTAHVVRHPPKYSFGLLYAAERVFALDVGPSRTHFDAKSLTVIRDTHWHTWPCENAQVDERSLGYSDWFREFLSRAKVTYKWRFPTMPQGAQIGLDYDDQ